MIELSIEQKALQNLAAAISNEEDGKKLRRQLARDLRDVAAPVVPEIVSGLMQIGSAGLPKSTDRKRAPGGQFTKGLRRTVASGIQVQARFAGRSTGVRVRIKRTPGFNNFSNAAKRMNKYSWRHRVFGKDVWVEQLGKENFFENPVIARQPELRDACMQAMEDMARRIKQRTES
jgi:hypothetical protein